MAVHHIAIQPQDQTLESLQRREFMYFYNIADEPSMSVYLLSQMHARTVFLCRVNNTSNAFLILNVGYLGEHCICFQGNQITQASAERSPSEKDTAR